MNLRDTIRDFGKKITPNFRDIRYCRFAPPAETAGVIDVSSAGDGSRGIAFLTDRLIVKLDGNARQMYYKDIRVMEILPSYETPFEDELLLDAKSGEIRISDCSMNKFFLRQLISNVSRITATMRESERAELLSQLAAEAREYCPDMPAVSNVSNVSNAPGAPAPEPVRTAVPTYAESEISPSAPAMPEAPDNPATDTEPLPEAAAAVQEIAAAKKAALAAAQNTSPIEITEEKIEWISGKSGKSDKSENTVKAEIDKIDKSDETIIVPEAPAPASAETPVSEKLPQTVPAEAREAEESDVSDLSHDQTISYLLDSIAEINSAPEQPAAPEISPERSEQQGQQRQPETVSVPQPEVSPELPKQEEAPEEDPPKEPAPALTKEPESTDIYILASRRIREICEEGRLTMEQVNTAVKEQLVPAAEIYSRLDVENAPLPPAVKGRARQLTAAADRLTEYFALGEDVAARVMFFMLYQMLSYTDRIVQSDETKQALNYFFVRFGPAGIILSMLEANN